LIELRLFGAQSEIFFQLRMLGGRIKTCFNPKDLRIQRANL
jgi:hypothetical protein